MCKMYKQMFNNKIIRIIFVIWLIKQQQLTVCVAGQKAATTTITPALSVIADVQHPLQNMRAAGLKQKPVIKIDDEESDSGTSNRNRNTNTITSNSSTTSNKLIVKNNTDTQMTLKLIDATARNAYTTNYTKTFLLAEATKAANTKTTTNSNRWSANVTTRTPLQISLTKSANKYNSSKQQVVNTENILNFPETNATHAGGQIFQNIRKSPEIKVSGKAAHNSYHSKLKKTSALPTKHQTPLTDWLKQHKAESTITKTTVHTSREQNVAESVLRPRQTIINSLIRNNNLNNKTDWSLQEEPTNKGLFPRILKDIPTKYSNNKAAAVLIKKGKFIQSADDKNQAARETVNKEPGKENFVKSKDKPTFGNVNAATLSFKGKEKIYHSEKEKSFQKKFKTSQEQRNDNKLPKIKIKPTAAQEKLSNITKKPNKLIRKPETVSHEALYLKNISSKAFNTKRDSSENFNTQKLSSQLFNKKKLFLKDISPKETSIKNFAIKKNSAKALSTIHPEIDQRYNKGVEENHILVQELQPSKQVLTKNFPTAFSLKAWEKGDSKSTNKISNIYNEKQVISKYALDKSANENTTEISSTYENSFEPENYESSRRIVTDYNGALLSDILMSSANYKTKNISAQKLSNFNVSSKVPLKPENQKIFIQKFYLTPETSTLASNFLTINKHDLNVKENNKKLLSTQSQKPKEKPQEMLVNKHQKNVSNESLYKNPEAKKEISFNSSFLRQKRLNNNTLNKVSPKQSSVVLSQSQTENYTAIVHNNLQMKNTKTLSNLMENKKTEIPPTADVQSVANINETQRKFRIESVELETEEVHKLEFIDEQKQLPSNATAIGNGNNVMAIKNFINTKQLDGKISQNIHHIDNGKHVVGEFNAINVVMTTAAAEFETTIPSKELEEVTTTKTLLSTNSTKEHITPTAVIKQKILESQTTFTTALAPSLFLTMRSLNIDNESFEHATAKSFTTANGPLSEDDLVNKRLNTVVEYTQTLASTDTTTTLMQLVSTATTNTATTTSTKLPYLYATTMSSFASPSAISSFLATSTTTSPSWPVKHASVVEGNVILGGLMMVHSREDSITCGPIMPQGGIQALEAMLYTLDQVNKQQLLPNITLGAHILDDCDKDTYGLEMAVDFIKGKSKICLIYLFFH